MIGNMFLSWQVIKMRSKARKLLKPLKRTAMTAKSQIGQYVDCKIQSSQRIDREIQKGNLRKPDCLAGEEQQAAQNNKDLLYNIIILKDIL